MRCQNAKEDIRLVLSWFSEAFSRPSFKIFSSFVVGFIQLLAQRGLIDLTRETHEDQAED